MNRTILHIDMDAFFASIEIVRNPLLKGKPVIVGGQPDSRGVVSTCSYEARKFGVRSAMPLSQAYRLCPHGIFLEGNYSLYKAYSQQIMALIYQVTPYVQPLSIDEAYLDVTQLSHTLSLAQHLKKEIFDATQLSCSIGIGANKLIAKIASGLAKPGGIREVTPGEEARFLAPLSIKHLPGIGAKTEELLLREGFKTAGDIQAFSLDQLIETYGTWGYALHQLAHGIDTRPVEWQEHAPKSIGAEHTFETDQTDLAEMQAALELLVERAWRDLKKCKMYTRSLTLKIRYNDFKTFTHAHTLFADTNDLNILKRESSQLFSKNYRSALPLRLIGISLRKLATTWQPTLWNLDNGVKSS